MMPDVDSATYSLESPSRTLAAQRSSTDSHVFLAGTSRIAGDNKIHLLEFDDDENSATCRAVFEHSAEIWRIRPAPQKQDVVLTCFSREGAGRADASAIWKMQNYENYVKQDSETDKRRNSAAVQSSALEMQVSLGICTHVQDVCWNSLTESLLISVQDEVLKLWDLNGARDKDMDILEGEILATTETNKPFTCGCWDPISPTNFIAGIGTGLGLIDTRTKPDRGSDLKIENAHLHKVLDVDANPNKPYHVISGGKDCLAKIWDLRRPMEPMTIIAGHSHWVTNVKYNRFHDQLILTAGTDSLVNLWSLVSISSAPLSDLEGNIYSPKSGEQDRLIRQFEEHEESVYTVDWSASDAWVFASLSYDGRVLFNRVPQGEKYKILL